MPIGTMWPPIWRWRNGGSQSIRTRNSISSCRPYSILFWDKVIREGRAEAVLAAIRQAGQTLLQYDNVKFYGYLMDPEIVTNLDNYCDYIHHSGGSLPGDSRHASKRRRAA